LKKLISRFYCFELAPVSTKKCFVKSCLIFYKAAYLIVKLRFLSLVKEKTETSRLLNITVFAFMCFQVVLVIYSMNFLGFMNKSKSLVILKKKLKSVKGEVAFV